VDEEEEIPETLEDDEVFEESPQDVLERCQVSSGVAPLDELKQGVVAWMAGQLDPDELLQRWSQLDQELFARNHYFQEGLRFQEWSEEFVELGRACFEQFEWIQEQMQRLEHSVQGRDSLEVVYALEQIQASLLELNRLYALLGERQAQEPQLCHNPWLAELLRLGLMAAEGRVPVESFLERLQIYSDLQERMRLALETALPTPAEAAVLGSAESSSREAFQAQLLGLEQLHQFAQDLDRIRLESGIESLEQAAATFTALSEQLQQAASKVDMAACPFCARENMVGTRHCAHCSARLPESDHFSLSSQSDVVSLPENFSKLSEAVNQYLGGRSSLPQLGESVAWFRQLHQGASRQLSGIAAAQPGTPGLEVEILEEARAMANHGLESVEQGLVSLELGLGQQAEIDRASVLQRGLELVLGGGQALLELEGVLARAQELARSSSGHALYEGQA